MLNFYILEVYFFDSLIGTLLFDNKKDYYRAKTIINEIEQSKSFLEELFDKLSEKNIKVVDFIECKK